MTKTDIERIRLERIRAILIRRKYVMNPTYWLQQWQKLQHAEAAFLRRH